MQLWVAEGQKGTFVDRFAQFSLRRAGKCDGPQHSCGLAQVEAYEDGAILGKRVEHHVAPHPKHTGRCIAWKDQCLSVQLQSDMCCNLQQRKPKCVEAFAPVVDAICKANGSLEPQFYHLSWLLRAHRDFTAEELISLFRSSSKRGCFCDEDRDGKSVLEILGRWCIAPRKARCLESLAERQLVCATCCKHTKSKSHSRGKKLPGWKLRGQRKGSLKQMFT